MLALPPPEQVHTATDFPPAPGSGVLLVPASPGRASGVIGRRVHLRAQAIDPHPPQERAPAASAQASSNLASDPPLFARRQRGASLIAEDRRRVRALSRHGAANHRGSVILITHAAAPSAGDRPAGAPVQAEVTIPGSKSITNRALVAAALTGGTTTLEGALWSEDTQVMVDCLGRLGFEVRVEPDAGEPANRRITVVGRGGEMPRAGSREAPLELHVGNAGTAARFLTALVCLGRGSYRLAGVPRMHERPQAALFEALSALGYAIDTPNGRLPAVVHGQGPRPGRTRVSVAESSQHASALLLAGQVGGWQVDIEGANPDELPYVEMTAALVRAFPRSGGVFAVEPDASSASYFRAAGFLLEGQAPARGSRVEVAGWPTSGWQIDAEFPRYLPLPRPTLARPQPGRQHHDRDRAGPLRRRADRVHRSGAAACARVRAGGSPAHRAHPLRGPGRRERRDPARCGRARSTAREIETYGDHRMAMCFATLGLVVPGIAIRDPACVRKTFPNFFAKLAAPPPAGLGVRRAGRPHARAPLARAISWSTEAPPLRYAGSGGARLGWQPGCHDGRRSCRWRGLRDAAPAASPSGRPCDEWRRPPRRRRPRASAAEAAWAQRGERAVAGKGDRPVGGRGGRQPGPRQHLGAARAGLLPAGRRPPARRWAPKNEQYLTTFEKGTAAGERSLAAQSPEFKARVVQDEKVEEAIRVVGRDGIPAMYWYAVNLGKWSRAKGIAALLGNKDRVRGVVERVLELDETFFHGAPHRYFGAYWALLPIGRDLDKSRQHFERSLAIAPAYAGTRVLMAETYAVKKQDRALYLRLLEEVLALPDDAIADLAPETRIEKDKARELQAKVDELF